VLDAVVRVRSVNQERTISVEKFVKGKRTTGLRPNEILVETRFAELDARSACSFEKVGMRNSLIIAFVNCAAYLKLDNKREAIEDVRIALNRTSGKIPQRARETERMLRGKKPDEQTLADAAEVLKGELKLTSDFRASEEYRMEVASTIFKRRVRSCAERLSGEKIVV
jgi:CO/xanthine dehydrogenase FAD-binding subunit